MHYPIRYSTRAYHEYESIIEYVSLKFGIAKAAEVDAYFESIIEMISLNPYMFPYSNQKKHIRRCVVSQQTTLYYRFLGECIEVISFRGNLMNPEALNL